MRLAYDDPESDRGMLCNESGKGGTKQEWTDCGFRSEPVDVRGVIYMDYFAGAFSDLHVG